MPIDAAPATGPALRPLAVGITPLETRRDVVLQVATRAEELGYTALFVAEGWGHDVSVLLAEIALRTSRIRIGSGVINVWGRSAASLAMLATSLAEVSGGRFVLGLGAGSPQLAEGLHDVAFRAPVERLGAVTRQVRRLLGGGRIVSSIPAGSRPLRLGVRPTSGIPIQLALGLGDAVDAVLEANQSQGSAEVPPAAQVLIDEQARREAERAAAQRRQQVEQLQHQIRQHAATHEWPRLTGNTCGSG